MAHLVRCVLFFVLGTGVCCLGGEATPAAPGDATVTAQSTGSAVSAGDGASFHFDEAKGTQAGTGKFVGAIQWTTGRIDSGIVLDGASQWVAIPGPAIDTSNSFSLMGWAQFDRADTEASIVSLDGQVQSAAALGYTPPRSAKQHGGFFFDVAAADSNAVAARRLLSPMCPAPHTWYHVAASYDSATHLATLYVDGAAVAQGDLGVSIAASGNTAVGRGQLAGTATAWWPGRLDEVSLAVGVLPAAQIASAYRAATAITPLRPPAVPLIVRNPYLSVWQTQDALMGNWPSFWTGTVKGLTGMLRVDDAVYLFMGSPQQAGGIASNATQTQLEITPTQSRYAFRAGRVGLYVNFISPIEADNLQNLSIPAGVIEVQAASLDGNDHTTTLYLDMTGEWAAGSLDTQINWAARTLSANPAPLTAFTMTPAVPTVLAETNDYATWGQTVWAAANTGNLSFAAAPDDTVRQAFLDGHSLSNSVDTAMPRAVDANWPTFAFTADMATQAGTLSEVHRFFVGHTSQPATSYLGVQQPPLWRSYYADWTSMFAAVAQDAGTTNLLQRANATDSRLTIAAIQAGGPHYAALMALALRQVFGGLQLVQTAADPWLFLKEISSDGNLSTVDVLYPLFPALLMTNPELLRYALAPVLTYSTSGHWPQPFAPHDLGASYPNATGHNDGGGENMPVEESANMLLMTAAYLQASTDAGAKNFVAGYYAVLKTWADYLVTNTLDPGLQAQTDDFSGPIAHSTNLALKGILGLGAMARMATTLGHSADAMAYGSVAQTYIAQWYNRSLDVAGTHLKLAYDQNNTWSLKYNAFPDVYLQLGLVPPAVLELEAAFYLQQAATYGIPLDGRHTYTKNDWELWTAAATPSAALRQLLIDRVYAFANSTDQRVPATDYYETATAAQVGFRARPVVGAWFSLLANPAPP